jgi:hypothetical protein
MARPKPKSVVDSYRLRMLFGKWFIYLYADKGNTIIKHEGPLAWNIASQQAANYAKDGLTDLDRLSDTQVAQ